ncbi:MAG: hypothetical protein A2V64_03305 [Bacteroidetes bacterium RBG_13_43_22]|nr:MAG: hypothetical protein A2V64_03305 [Bacteroidetes bacterium RBG_13_43_22]
MKTLRCIAVDDEPPALQKIEMYISKIPFLVLKGKFLTGIEAIEYIQRNEVDLMFLDIQMDDISGLKVIESLSKKPIAILTTAYASYAVKGFELNVCDYLLKPFDFERFLQASTKALNQFIAYNEVRGNEHDEGSTISNQKEFIFVKTAYKYKKVRIDDILYLQGMRDYIMIHTTGGKIMTLSSFSEIERLLPESKFFRIHKSYVVAISKIEAIDRKRAIIAKEYLPISNTYYDAFILFLKNKSIITR